MSCSKRNVFTPCSFSRFYKIFRPRFFNVETLDKVIVFFFIRFRIQAQIPFAFADYTVKPEVDEQTEPDFFEFLYIFEHSLP